MTTWTTQRTTRSFLHRALLSMIKRGITIGKDLGLDYKIDEKKKKKMYIGLVIRDLASER